MPDDKSQRLRRAQRMAALANQDERADIDGLIEEVVVNSVTTGGGAVSTATSDEGETLEVYEQYGFASNPGSGSAVALAVGADHENRVAVAVASTTGRPSTEDGDSAMWTAAGHSLVMDDDGGVTLTAKDGSSVDLDAAGTITVSAGPAANVTINVDPGAFVNAGGTLSLALGQALSNAIDAMLAAGVPILGDGGTNLKATMIAGWNAVKATIQTTITRGA